MSTSAKGVARATRCLVNLVKNGNGISLSVHLANVNKRESGNTSAVSMKEWSQLRVAYLETQIVSIGRSVQGSYLFACPSRRALLNKSHSRDRSEI